ncbi:hypothetical protein ACFVS2_25850 [Brevibacillus sp. NPDC058079]|uniref:hypothetical protein n=1 Tax=Brevibacillus sp. NPDC058079 TaxID=3346330 RepID=UPI0036F0482B
MVLFTIISFFGFSAVFYQELSTRKHWKRVEEIIAEKYEIAKLERKSKREVFVYTGEKLVHVEISKKYEIVLEKVLIA